MNKKQTNSAILAGIAISAILVASSIITGASPIQQALGQAATAPPPSAAAPTAPPPSAAAPTAAPPSGAAAPPLGRSINWQGTVSSTASPLAGHGKDQVAVILPLRSDGALYTGVITFTASKAVQPEVWQQLSGVGPTTLIPRQFGSVAISPSPSPGKGFVATALVGTSATSGSVPFAGNALALRGSAPFIATYSVTAQPTAGKVTNNITSATTAGAAAAAAPASLGGTTAGTSIGGTSGGTSSSGTSGGTSSSGTSGGTSSTTNTLGQHTTKSKK